MKLVTSARSSGPSSETAAIRLPRVASSRVRLGARAESVYDDAGSVTGKNFTPHEINHSTIPHALRIHDRGQTHTASRSSPGLRANLTPQQLGKCLSRIECY